MREEAQAEGKLFRVLTVDNRKKPALLTMSPIVENHLVPYLSDNLPLNGPNMA